MDLITINREDRLKFNIQVRGHEVASDMSVKDGGQDAAPVMFVWLVAFACRRCFRDPVSPTLLSLRHDC